jgi:hypothetical protein
MKGSRYSRGQSSTEYLIVTLFAILLLINGDPSPLEMFFDAIKQAYQHFTNAMSMP